MPARACEYISKKELFANNSAKVGGQDRSLKARPSPLKWTVDGADTSFVDKSAEVAG